MTVRHERRSGGTAGTLRRLEPAPTGRAGGDRAPRRARGLPVAPMLLAGILAAAAGCGDDRRPTPTGPGVTRPPVTTPPDRPPGGDPAAWFDDAFWKQFAFNDHDCRTAADCREAGYEYVALERRMLWRLPSPSPSFFLLTTHMDRPLVDRLRETIPRAVSQLTGVPFSGVIDDGTEDLRSRRGWIVVEGGGGGVRPESGSCSEVEVASFCGWSYVGRERGCIVLNTRTRPACLTRSLIMHEIGHALGFYHTSGANDIMHPTGLAIQGGQYSPLEQSHGAFAYTQPRGARYPDAAPRGFGPLPTPFVMPPLEHGGLVVD